MANKASVSNLNLKYYVGFSNQFRMSPEALKRKIVINGCLVLVVAVLPMTVFDASFFFYLEVNKLY